MDKSPTAPDLFEGTAWYYARYRPGYPSEAFDALVKRFGLNGSTHLLDLGCGTGQIALQMAVRGIPVHAVDPEVEMLAEGLRAQRRAETHGIAWLWGDDKKIEELHLPLLAVCTMGASFHWTDRDRVLQVLNGMIVENGGVAVLSAASVWTERQSESGQVKGSTWSEVAKDVIVEFLGPERRAGGGVYKHPAERHEVVLARSPFSRVEKLAFVISKTITVNEIVGLQLSTSYASPAQLGPRLDEFKQRLSDRLLEFEPSGLFHGEETTDLLIATR